MKIDYTNLSFTQLIDKIEANRFFDLPRMVREAFRRLLTRVEALEDSPTPSESFIPLSGTEVGNPVTGDIEISGESSLRTDTYTGVFISSNDDLVRLLRGETQIILDSEPYITVDAPYSSQGLHGTQDFTGNITDLDYTQKNM